MALITDSSVAWITAANIGFIFQLCIRSIFALASVNGGSVLFPSSAFELAVENARKMSPDPSPSIAPTRPNPTETRRASRFDWSAG